MIIQLQEGAKKYGLHIIAWSVLISMGVGYFAMLFDNQKSISNSPTLMSVNGNIITASMYEHTLGILQQRVQAIKAQFGTQADYFLSLMGLDNVKKYATNSLVNNELLAQLADKAGIVTEQSYIPLMLNNPSVSFELLLEVLPMSVFDQKGNLSSSMLNNYLKQHGISLAQIEQMLLQRVKQSIIQSTTRSCAHVLNKQVLEAYAQGYQKRSYSYFILNQDSYAANKSSYSDETLKEFYSQENKKNKRYWSQEQRQGLLTKFTAKNWGITPTDREIKEYYAHHKALFVHTPVQLQVRHILLLKGADDQANEIIEQLKKDPTQFEQLAQHYSQDKDTASAGGLMPVFSKATHDPVFERAAFSLKTDNEISGPIQTAQGIEIIQRVNRKPIVYKSLPEAQELIKERLITQKFSYTFSQFMHQWIAQPTPSIEQLILQKNAEGPVSVSYTKSDSSAASKKLFSLKKDGQAFLVQKTEGLLLKLTNIIPAGVIDFEQCKEQVFKDYQQQEAEKTFNKHLDAIKKQISMPLKPQEFKNIAIEYGQKIKSTSMIAPQDKLNEIEQNIIALSKPQSAGIFTLKQGVVVAYVRESSEVDEKQLEAKRAEVKASLEQTMQSAVIKGLVASLYRNATINTDKTLDL